MARPENSAPDLRLAVPTLEPDPAFLAQLSGLAAGSAATGPPAGMPGPGWRAGVAAASVATIVAGGAWVAAAVGGDEAPHKPTTPVTQPVDPDTDDPAPGPSEDTDEQQPGRGGHDRRERSGAAAPQDEGGEDHQDGPDSAPPIPAPEDEDGPEQDEQGEDQDDQGEGDQGSSPGDDQGDQGDQDDDTDTDDQGGGTDSGDDGDDGEPDEPSGDQGQDRDQPDDGDE